MKYEKFSNELLKDLCDGADIVSTIGSYVELKKAGKEFTALCPFHNEKNPSFTVSHPKQFYHCFGCGAHGSVIDFYVNYAGMSFVEAVEKLALDQGRQLPVINTETTLVESQQKKHVNSLTNVLERAMRIYYGNLRKHPHSVEYIKGRNLSRDTVQTFLIGYAHKDDIVTQITDVETNLLVEAGLVTANGQTGEVYDKFRRRIMFPIHNEKGVIIGFGGRVLNDDLPKYLNSVESAIFQKGDELFGLYFAKPEIRKQRSVILFEGYMDVVMLHQHGCKNAVAALGTSLSEKQLLRLFKIADDLVFCFDGDKAGQAAAIRAARLSLSVMRDGKTAKFLLLPDDHDPDSYVQQFGIEQWNSAVANALPLSQKIISMLFDEKDVSVPEIVASIAKEAFELLAMISHAPLFSNALQVHVESKLGFSLQRPRSVISQSVNLQALPLPFNETQYAFYVNLASLCSLDVKSTEDIDNELIDAFSMLIIGWFNYCPGTIAEQVEHNATTSDAKLKSTIYEALNGLSQRLKLLPNEPSTKQREINGLLSAIGRASSRSAASSRVNALFN